MHMEQCFPPSFIRIEHAEHCECWLLVCFEWVFFSVFCCCHRIRNESFNRIYVVVVLYLLAVCESPPGIPSIWQPGPGLCPCHGVSLRLLKGKWRLGFREVSSHRIQRSQFPQSVTLYFTPTGITNYNMVVMVVMHYKTCYKHTWPP